jgi:hypothetical protein
MLFARVSFWLRLLLQSQVVKAHVDVILLLAEVVCLGSKPGQEAGGSLQPPCVRPVNMTATAEG